MAKLYFKYGAMKSGKTLDLIRTYDSYKLSERVPYVISPRSDNRHGVGVIRSRIGVDIKSVSIQTGGVRKRLENVSLQDYDVVLVDEAQFFTEDDILFFREVATDYDVPVITYGLKTTFQGKLFEGSKALLELSEDISEVKAICAYCGKKATHNLRLDNGVPVYEGDVVQIGDSEYVQACYKHWRDEGK